MIAKLLTDISVLGNALKYINVTHHNKQCVYLSLYVQTTFQPKNSYADATFNIDIFYD